MSILIDKDTKVLVQGITGKSGSLQAKIMMEFGTEIVAGVTPGKGGMAVHGIPVYDYIAEAKKDHDFNTVISFVPPAAIKDSSFEAIDAGIRLLVVTTEGIAQNDVVEIIQYARNHNCYVVGPGCAGVIAPGITKVGSHPDRFFKPGRVGVVSKSGALSYEICKTLTDAGIGQSTVASIGGGPIWGFSQKDAVELFEKDPDTDVIVLLGEIGGNQEERAAEYIAKHVKKPVVSLIVGRNAPQGKSLGHAGAIVSGNVGTASTKINALTNAGATVVKNPTELVEKVYSYLNA
ncbi:MAG TPA: succinate--CoA ligase subunit alpha [Bacillota bacterium]|nr:succinate--CoA ligase subunit alpha [Bacillota bacterium]HOR86436.1 succinate--CoA ligase subunit alpha [Bacillota bacterium]HPL53053.1 succinate--CoA ligase subunit alpha [Bacillota bacterium]